MIRRGVQSVNGVGSGKMLSCGEAQVRLPLAVCFREVNPERGPIMAEEWLSIPLLQVVVKRPHFSKHRRAMSTICFDVKGASPNST